MIEKNLNKEKAKKQRVTNGMNTGTRNMKSAKDYDRKSEKQKIKKMLDE